MLDKIRKLREKKGFTLVELIVVIAIIAILTAVLVPLIGRYSAQATYTTLQDAAQTISNDTNNVISDVTMMGTTYNDKVVVGSKVDGKLTVTVYEASKTASDDGKISSDSKASDTTGYDAASTKPTDPDGLVAAKVWDAFNDTLPNTAYFYVWIGNSTVKGVIYSTSTPLDGPVEIEANTNFTDAYDYNSSAIGVSGTYKPAPASSS